MAVADPVLVGISDRLLARARRRSLCGASTTVCVLVMSWMVVTDPEGFVDHLDHRRQTVGGARGGGKQVMCLGVVKVIVDAHHDVQRARFHRGRDDHFADTGRKVRLE